MSHLPEDRFEELVAAERAREHPPLNTWAEISQRAREEGLIRRDRRSLWTTGRPWMQAAAGIVILLGGITIGRSTTDAADATVAGSPSAGSASGATETPAGAISSVDEAWRIIDRAGADYQKASAFIAAQNTAAPAVADSVSIYRTRLAALDRLMNATVTAREHAPNDPMINQYYLAALGAREATVQQLGAVRPASLRPRGF